MFIKKCPLCGSDAKTYEISNFPTYSTECSNHACRLNVTYRNDYRTKEESIEAWNKRFIEDKLVELAKNVMSQCTEMRCIGECYECAVMLEWEEFIEKNITGK